MSQPPLPERADFRFACAAGHRWTVTGSQQRTPAPTHSTCPHCGRPAVEATALADSTEDAEAGTAASDVDRGDTVGGGVADRTLAGDVTLADSSVLPGVGQTTGAPEGTLAEAPRGDESPGLPAIPGHTLLDVLGRGGMGVVYRARHEQLGRLVAVKTLISGLAPDDPLRQRFAGEARAAARLQHDHITRLYEVGESGGQPWLSLEYVDGGTLSDAIRKRPFHGPDAARLVEQLARALDYSHRQGIVHRDLKPANVLLTREGVPKVTDFGLAKWISEESGLSRHGEILGTVSYMAPEQAQGSVDAIGPPADIYALGAILYEMLTGRPPFYAAEPYAAMQMVIRDEPLAPRRLQPELPRDLETICLKCLEKSPARRYESAAALADELGRFVRGEPILARPVGQAERLYKWARRRPAAAALIGVSLLAATLLVGGGLWYNHQLRLELARSERLRREVQRELGRSERLYEGGRKFAQWVLFDHLQDLERLDGSTKSQQRLVLRITSYQDLLAQDAAGDTRLSEDLAAAYERIGWIQGDPNHVNLGRREEALASYDKALEIYERLLERPADPFRVRINYLTCRAGRCGILEALGRDEEAKGEYQRLVDQLTALGQQHPTQTIIVDRIANVRDRLAGVHQTLGEYPQALQQMRQALQLRLQSRDAAPDDVALQREVAKAKFSLGQLLDASDQLDEARSLFEEANQAFGELVRQDPHDGEAAYEWSLSLIALADIELRQDQPEAARPRYEQALELRRKRAAAEPDSPQVQRQLTVALERLGGLHAAAGQPADAASYFRQGAELLGQSLRRHPADLYLQHDLLIFQNKLAGALMHSGQVAEARTAIDEAQRLVDRLLAQNAEDLVALNMAAELHGTRGDWQIARPQPESSLAETLEAYQQAAESYGRAIEGYAAAARVAPLTPDQQRMRDSYQQRHQLVKEAVEKLKGSGPQGG